MTTLFVKHLTVIDFSFLDPQQGVVGESFIVDIALSGPLNHEGMVLDFSEVKKRIKHAIDQSIDHTLVVPLRSPSLSIQKGAQTTLTFQFGTQSSRSLSTLFLNAPAQSLFLLESEEVTPKTVTDALLQTLSPILSPQQTLQMKLYPEDISGAYYHYTHGLKKHKGHCQRIAHGHRSRIEIYINDQRQPTLEKAWSQQLNTKFLGTQEDQCPARSTNDQSFFSYEAPEGRFELQLPQAQCYLMETETTVEYIAEHLATEIQKQYPHADKIEVHAFEGVHKGAIATRTT
jgi:6-pyruvoyl-tetrahydropterin synthase